MATKPVTMATGPDHGNQICDHGNHTHDHGNTYHEHGCLFSNHGNRTSSHYSGDRDSDWAIVAASYVGHFLVGLTFAMFSVFYLEFTDHFHMDKGVTGWIGSLNCSCLHFTGIVSSVIIQRHGCRPVCIAGSVLAAVGYLASSFAPNITVLYLTFGILSGCGNGMVFLSSTVIVQQHFHQRRALAAGIAAAGISVGTVTSGPVVRWLLDIYEWRGTLLLISAIYLNGIAAGVLYRPVKCHINILKSLPEKLSPIYKHTANAQEEKTAVVYTPEKDARSRAANWRRIVADMFDFSLFRNSSFVFFCLTTFCLTMGMMPMYQHMTSRAVHSGIGIHRAAWLPSALGVATMLSRLLFSFISNSACVNRYLQYGISVALGGAVEVLSVLAGNFTMYLGFCVMYGFVNGSYMTVQPTVLVDLLGVANIARAQALLSLFLGMGNLLSIPFAGFLFDVTQNYDIPFHVLGGLQILGGLLILPAFCVRRHLTLADI